MSNSSSGNHIETSSRMRMEADAGRTDHMRISSHGLEGIGVGGVGGALQEEPSVILRGQDSLIASPVLLEPTVRNIFRRNSRGENIRLLIENTAPNSFRVTNQRDQHQYRVRYGAPNEPDTCECRGHRFHHHCYHMDAVRALFNATPQTVESASRQVISERVVTGITARMPELRPSIHQSQNDNFSLKGLSADERVGWFEHHNDGEFADYRTENVLNGSPATFGMELEMVGIRDKAAFIADLRRAGLTTANNVVSWGSNSAALGLSGWIPTKDGSLGEEGIEVVSPVLSDTPETWQQLEAVCEIAKRHGGIVNDKCGGHIHIGANLLGHDQDKWTNFFRLFRTVEPTVDILSRSGNKQIRSGAERYAALANQSHAEIGERNESESIELQELYNSEYMSSSDHRSSLNRYSAVNATQLTTNSRSKPTIEFRRFNGTVDPKVLQANVALSAFLIQAAATKTPQEIDDFCREYQQIPERQAKNRLYGILDFITTREEDKVRLLKSYIKNRRIGDENNR